MPGIAANLQLNGGGGVATFKGGGLGQGLIQQFIAAQKTPWAKQPYTAWINAGAGSAGFMINVPAAGFSTLMANFTNAYSVAWRAPTWSKTQSAVALSNNLLMASANYGYGFFQYVGTPYPGMDPKNPFPNGAALIWGLINSHLQISKKAANHLQALDASNGIYPQGWGERLVESGIEATVIAGVTYGFASGVAAAGSQSAAGAGASGGGGGSISATDIPPPDLPNPISLPPIDTTGLTGAVPASNLTDLTGLTSVGGITSGVGGAAGGSAATGAAANASLTSQLLSGSQSLLGDVGSTLLNNPAALGGALAAISGGTNKSGQPPSGAVANPPAKKTSLTLPLLAVGALVLFKVLL